MPNENLKLVRGRGARCGPVICVTIQAFVMNLQGQKSNMVEYTIHCNGG